METSNFDVLCNRYWIGWSWIDRENKPLAKTSITGSLHNCVLRVLIQAVFGRIRGDIDGNNQGIQTGVQSEDVRTHVKPAQSLPSL